LSIDGSEESPLNVLQQPEVPFEVQTFCVGSRRRQASAGLGFLAGHGFDLLLQLGDVHVGDLRRIAEQGQAQLFIYWAATEVVGLVTWWVMPRTVYAIAGGGITQSIATGVA
jgi:hypothetical protein